jgi:hypothetical protein
VVVMLKAELLTSVRLVVVKLKAELLTSIQSGFLKNDKIPRMGKAPEDPLYRYKFSECLMPCRCGAFLNV